MIGENRVLTRAGLKKLKFTGKCGLVALMNVARIKPETITSKHIGFGLGPRINAMGRVGSANRALDLLMCADSDKARGIAAELDKENRNRQTIEKELLAEVLGVIEQGPDLDKCKAIVLAGDGWHPGVIGIVASRIVDAYGLPAILISLDGDTGKGSGRSTEGVNLFEAINEVKDLLVTFGGHEAACGLKIKKKNIDSFRHGLNSSIMKGMAGIEAVRPELKIDLSLPFSHIGTKLISELGLLMPYGPENSEPVFSTHDISVKNIPRDIGRSGFKFLAKCGNLTCEAITFNKNKVAKPSRGSVINLAYTPSINSWEGIDTIQLNIRDLQVVS